MTTLTEGRALLRELKHPTRIDIVLALADPSVERLSPSGYRDRLVDEQLAVRGVRRGENAERARKAADKVVDAQGMTLGALAYHFRKLHERRVVVPAGTRRRRGAVEHFYRLSAKGEGLVP